LVNSRWNQSLTSRLYQQIHLSTEEQAGSLLFTLKQNPEKRRLIRSLVVTIPAQRDSDDSEQIPAHRYLRNLFHKNLPALEHVYLLTSTFMSAITYMKDCVRGKVSLTRITIVSHGPCVTMSMSYIWSVLKAFPNLEEFCFQFTGTDGRKEETPRTLPAGLLLQKIKKLSVVGIAIDNEIVEELCCRCPNLEEMAINGEKRFALFSDSNTKYQL